MALAARHALIAGLRHGRSETELTRALASVFAVEPLLAVSFLKLVLEHAPRAGGVDLSGLPAEGLECRAERSLEEGRADLSFTDAAGRWHAIVEIKIYAGYGPDQVRRYLRSLPPVKHGVVVAVTRDVPTYGESTTDKRWAGSVQWSTLLPGLRQLRPVDPDLAAQWPLFLDVLEAEGDMGFTKANDELFRAWANYPIARQHLMEFIDTMRRALLDELRLALVGPGRSGEAAAEFSTRGKLERAVIPRLGTIHIGFRVPADGPERLWVGVWGCGELYFFVEVGYPVATEASAKRCAKAVESLVDQGFTNVRDSSLTREIELTAELLADDELQVKMLEFARESFAMMKRSGVFKLGATPDAASMHDEAADVD